MNKRIRELQLQAFEQCKTFEGDNIKTDDAFEKFAELIIRECADVSFEHWEQHKGCSAHFTIREHFGIKE